MTCIIILLTIIALPTIFVIGVLLVEVIYETIEGLIEILTPILAVLFLLGLFVLFVWGLASKLQGGFQ